MRKKIIQYSSLIFLLAPLIFSFLPWYGYILITSSLDDTNLNGFEVLITDGSRILIIYLYCSIIQYLAIIYKKYVFAIIGILILILELTVFATYFYPLKYSRTLFLKTFSTGYYIALVLLSISICLNIKDMITIVKAKKEKKRNI